MARIGAFNARTGRMMWPGENCRAHHVSQSAWSLAGPQPNAPACTAPLHSAARRACLVAPLRLPARLRGRAFCTAQQEEGVAPTASGGGSSAAAAEAPEGPAEAPEAPAAWQIPEAILQRNAELAERLRGKLILAPLTRVSGPQRSAKTGMLACAALTALAASGRAALAANAAFAVTLVLMRCRPC